MLKPHPALAILTIVLLVGASASAKPGRQRKAPSRPETTSRLDAQSRKAILSAVEDERRAKAFYSAVIASYGEFRPFSNLVQAEGRHESALLALAASYDIVVPADPWATDRMKVPGTLAAVYREAIQLEKQNVAMYDGFLAKIQQEDIRAVMSQLRWASAERHLPALERHVGGGQGRGAGLQGQNGRGGGAGCPGCCAAGRGWRGGRGQ